jgi:hypothetical protein
VNELPDPRGPTYRIPPPPPPDPTGWHELRRRAGSTLWPPRPVAWAGLFALLVACAGLYGLWFQATLPGRLPSATDWKAAAAVIARDARPGDVVALAPAWAERAREVLPERLPARPDVALPVLALPSYAAADEELPGVRRVWLLSLPDAPGGPGPAAAQLAARSTAVEPPLRLGRIELARYDVARPLLAGWSLSERLPTATLEGGVATPVAREIREVAFLPRHCVVARFPAPRPVPLRLRLPPAPVGASLRGHVGLVGDPVPGDARAAVTLRVDGEEVARAEAGPRPAWVPLRADTSRLPHGPHEVSVEIAPTGALPLGVCVELLSAP